MALSRDLSKGLAGMLCLLSFLVLAARSHAVDDARDLMLQVRAQIPLQPYLYEEVRMVMVDRAGRTSVRRARHFRRLETDRSYLMLVFTHPVEIRGVTLLAKREGTNAPTQAGLYLPAMGERMLRGRERVASLPQIPGTDFTLDEFVPEQLEQHRYRRLADQEHDGRRYHVVEAWPRAGDGQRRRVLYINQATLYVERTDYLDRNGDLHRRLSALDVRQHADDTWHAAMLLLEDFRERHSSLLKVVRRVHAESYVPRELFNPEAVYAAQNLLEPGRLQARDALQVRAQ